MKTSLCRLAIAAALTASPVAAEPLKFILTGTFSASFVLPSDPVPDEVSDAFESFTVYDVPLPDASGLGDVSFFSTAHKGGLMINDFYDSGTTVVNAAGAQLFTGSYLTPTFVTGTFVLSGLPNAPGDYTLTIAAVPEPGAWAMLVGGFGVVGAALRRRPAVVA